MRLCTLLFVLVAFGCSASPPASPAPSSPDAPAASAVVVAIAPATEGHAPAAVVPGSHEDWCGEHGVAESQCTRCNQDLVAAFQATSDWCAEHGLPESQCKLCNPDLVITRPPKPGT